MLASLYDIQNSYSCKTKYFIEFSVQILHFSEQLNYGLALSPKYYKNNFFLSHKLWEIGYMLHGDVLWI